MNLHLRILLGRIRSGATLTVLRLVGLTLAVTLAAVIPTFVAGATEQVLRHQLATVADPLTAVVGWTAPDDGAYAEQLTQLDLYLREGFPRASDLSGAQVGRLTTSAQAGVQQIAADGSLRPGRRWLNLGADPGGLELVQGREPAAGADEAVMLEGALARNGYELGTRVRVPITIDGMVSAVDLTIVGAVRLPEGSVLEQISGPLGSALLIRPELWEELAVPAGAAHWAVHLSGEELRAAGTPQLLAALRQLPIRVGQYLPDADVISTPIMWVSGFVQELSAMQRFLLVLLTPVFLLVVVFILATANMVVDSRRVEIAVLRSRGARPLRVIGHYLPESALFAALALLMGLLITPALARLMGLSAGFLQLVDRPPMTAVLTGQTLLYALLAALLAEMAALVPLVQATRWSVVTIRQESPVHSAVANVLRVVGELAVLALLGYGTWRLLQEGKASDPIYLALPSLALAAAGLVTLRLLALLLLWADRLLRPWLSPSLYLAVTLLRTQSGRHRSLALMLVLTAGLGVYGAAFARTLDRDLVAQTDYRLGADVVMRPVWESEVDEYNELGEVVSVIHREPPYSHLQELPGAVATARVQLRRDVSLASGTRNLGRTDVMGIAPDEFAQVARFWPELTGVHPFAYLAQLAADEQVVLISQSLASRTGLKPGDQIRLKQEESEVTGLVGGVVPYWPGRLPEQGDFVVANLPYLLDGLGLSPYDIWLRIDPDASLEPIVSELQLRGIRLSSLFDARAEIGAGRREPFRLGIYGTLSAGFLVAIFVMGLTYLLSVGLTLQSRAKELGVVRAMGMGSQQVATSLYVEQLVQMGSAALTGILAGLPIAALYVPILRQQGNPVLPLQIAAVAGDRLSIALVFGLALLLGALTVRLWLKRLHINAVLRLGEDG